MQEMTTCKKFMVFRYTDLKAICEYLESMSEKGWEFIGMSRYMVEFKKTEPRKVRYAVELLDTASAYGDEISEKSQEYIDMCEQAGWEFVCNRQKMYIFRTEDENAPEIVSDSHEKLQNIKNAVLKTFLIWWIIGLIGLSFEIYSRFKFEDNIAELATSNTMIMYLALILMYIVIIVFEILGFIIWYIKSKRALNNNKPIPYINLKGLKLRKLEVIIPISIVLICMMVNIFSLNYIDRNWGEIRKGAKYKSSGTLAVSNNNIPVTVLDFGAEKADYNKSHGSKSLIASRYYYRSASDVDGITIWYEIYYSKFDFLLDSYIDYAKTDRELKEIDAIAWGADKAYVDEIGDVLIIYDDYILNCYYLQGIDSKENNLADTFKAVFEKID